MNKNRDKRLAPLRSMPLLARLDHRYFLDEQGNHPLLSMGSRKERRIREKAAKKIAENYHKHIIKLSESGARYPVDQFLRQLAIEYTHRYASSGAGTQPTNFNYFEPFLHLKLFAESVAPYPALCREHNHLFSALDFFDYLTESSASGFTAADLLKLPDAEIMHFTANGHVMDLTFLGPGGREFVISGFSLVRRGSSIHWFLVGGQLFSPDEWHELQANGVEISIEDIAPWKRPFLKEAIERNKHATGSPTVLEGTSSAQKVILCGEFDVAVSRHLGRCIMFETDHSFAMFCDDPDVVVGLAKERAEKIIENMMSELKKLGAMWNLAEGLFQLPHYFAHRERIEEEILKKAGKTISVASKGGQGPRGRFKIVPALEVQRTGSVVREVNLPHYRTETEGHWRRLDADALGRDRDGNPVVGKTWVKASNQWREFGENDDLTVYVKDRVALAKLKIEQIIDLAEKSGATSILDSPAVALPELYILRCSVMEDEVYKVGWTSGTAVERARQLSADTGVPVSFLVVKSWQHVDAGKLEVEAHAMLAPYRLNDRREFFRAPLTVIVDIMEAVVARAAQ